MVKKELICPKKGEYIRWKNYERKIKSLFMFYVDFESMLVPEDNGKQNRIQFLYKQILKRCCLQL